MMLSAADFDELFPPMSKRNAFCAHGPSPSPGATCIARWEDDGGRPSHRPEPRPAGEGIPVRRTPFSGYRTADPGTAGIALAILPAIAAYGAASAVLATLSGLSRS
jgi:hypothetical protein